MVILHLDSLETKMKFNRSKVMFLSWNKAPSARFGDLLGLRGQKHSEALGSTRKHSEAQRNSGTHKWCPATAEEKRKDVIEILVLFCSPLLERQSQPEKMRASGRKSITVSDLDLS